MESNWQETQRKLPQRQPIRALDEQKKEYWGIRRLYLHSVGTAYKCVFNLGLQVQRP